MALLARRLEMLLVCPLELLWALTNESLLGAVFMPPGKLSLDFITVSVEAVAGSDGDCEDDEISDGKDSFVEETGVWWLEKHIRGFTGVLLLLSSSPPSAPSFPFVELFPICCCIALAFLDDSREADQDQSL